MLFIQKKIVCPTQANLRIQQIFSIPFLSEAKYFKASLSLLEYNFPHSMLFPKQYFTNVNKKHLSLVVD